MKRSSLILLLVGLACRTQESPPTAEDSITTRACGDTEAVVTFETDDGETLVADYTPGPESGSGAVVLLHMAPTSGFHRGNWPVEIRRSLAETGVAVLNVDRRGAGDSTGEPEDAAEGDGARLDAEAAIRALLDSSSACPVNPDRLQIMGASNGTTAAFDYTVAHDPSLPDLHSLVFLSPGTYTENQNAIDGGWNLSFPILWVYPFNEPFSDGFVADSPGAWEFFQAGSRHGTSMFEDDDLRVTVGTELTRFLNATAAQP